jgi:hypothetical protein
MSGTPSPSGFVHGRRGIACEFLASFYVLHVSFRALRYVGR